MNKKILPLPKGLSRLSLIPVLMVLVMSSCNYIVPNKPPYVEKIQPADNAEFTIGQIVNFKVNAYDVDGSISMVVFKTPDGAEFVDNSEPYEFAWSTAGLTMGTYRVEIKAIDNKDEPYIIKVPVSLLGNLTAFAGKDTLFTDSRTSYVLEAILPSNSQGTWTIISGTGGQISDLHDPHALLSGQSCQTYILRWTLTNSFSTVTDEVSIGFNYLPSKAVAGVDQWITDGRATTALTAVIPADGSGLWKIISGGTGAFSDATRPDAAFTGVQCATYQLVWTVSTACAISADTVQIRFKQNLVDANAGPDQFYTDGRTSTTLAANAPAAGTGTWSVISGRGGLFADPYDAHSRFTGEPCTAYVLQWTIRTLCESSTDEITVSFTDAPSTANAGPDQNLNDGTVYVQLNATPPLNGRGLWTVISGGSGSFSDPASANSMFYGQLCHSYVLRWTVSTTCNFSFDEVNIVLNQVEITADAGPDRRISDGSLSVILQGNVPRTGMTGTWSIISGLGGTLQNPGSPASVFTGVSGQIYSLKWTLSGACMENSDLVTIAFIPAFTLTDPRDGKTYTAILIGNQSWMSENLNYTSQGSYAYDNNTSQAATYGRLYDWNAASSACPPGWHLPDDSEWRDLEGFLGMDAGTRMLEWYRGHDEGGMLKENGTATWAAPNEGASNITGFTARPGGYRTSGSIYGGLTVQAGFWTSTVNISDKAIYRALHKDKSQVGRDWYDKGFAFSIRCVKN